MFLPDSVVHAALAEVTSVTRWCGLSTTEPVLQADGTYSNVTEPTAASYARVQVAPGDWSAPADRYTQAEVVFPDPVDDYGVVVAWVHFSDATGGDAELAGVPQDTVELSAASSDVTVVCRIEAPSAEF